MLIFDFYKIGNKLYNIRKKEGFTQSEVAERAGLSDRTYADIERGSVNMRIETILKICKALNISPNDVLTEEEAAPPILQTELLNRLEQCTKREQNTALQLLSVYLDSL